MSGINLPAGETNLWRIVQAILAVARGASNSVGTVTLRANQTTTTVSGTPAAQNIAPGMQIFLQPITANAAAAMSGAYISSVGQKTFTITHASDANADKTFAWEARG